MSLNLTSTLGEILGLPAPKPLSLAQRLWNLARARRFANERSRRQGMSAKTHGRTYEDVGGRNRKGYPRGVARLLPASGPLAYSTESPNQLLARKRRERTAAA